MTTKPHSSLARSRAATERCKRQCLNQLNGLLEAEVMPSYVVPYMGLSREDLGEKQKERLRGLVERFWREG